MENKELEKKEPELEQKVSVENVPEELNDEMLNNVAGGGSESGSDDESNNGSRKGYIRIMKPIIL